jgi:hypothetical protein
MEKVVTNEMSKFLIILSVGLIALSALLSQMVSRIRGSFKPFQKATIAYLLVSLLVFALIALASQIDFFSDPVNYFIFSQVSFLLLGIANFYLMHRYLRWSGDEKSFWQGLLFTLIESLLGCIGYTLVYRMLHQDGMEYFMAASICFFIIPMLFFYSFIKALSIPPKIMRQWFYPVHEEIGEPDENKLKNLLIISFEFQKQTGDPHYTNFRAKAPGDMEFGSLFYYFINNYNERHPDNKIQFINNSGEPHGWIFYKKPRWYSFFTDYKDPEKSIYNNNIRENDVIICSRYQN